MHHRLVRELLTTMDIDWRECMKVDQHLHVMKTNASFSKFCTHFLFYYNTITGSLYFGGDNLVAIVQILRGYNVTSRPFPTKLLLPFDAEQSPIYAWIVLVLYLHSMSVAYLDNFLTAFIISLVSHASGQIEIMCQELKASSKEIQSNGSLAYTTRMLIQNHNKVISFSKNIDRLFSYIALMLVFGDTIIICFLGLVVMTSHSIHIITLLKIFFAYFGVTMEVFIYCFVGEHLGHKSKLLGDAGYDSLWYNKSSSHRKNILFIIMRSQKQLNITAGNMVDLSLETFTSIIKASASYMSVLNATY
ncbi:odorant receptor 13a-like [Odontomachus brunneus]|uniref:odorant receptor 13a-like n=1 Tax=Odontomachus brunneus TaxID=486640 RepID=UPI0013F20209|nr:odorant receptor 13a-like [Odontomachus brunneus]